VGRQTARRCCRSPTSAGAIRSPHDDVRRADDPDATLLNFLQSTYEVAADLAGWDWAALER
jgi:hypothetical protein